MTSAQLFQQQPYPDNELANLRKTLTRGIDYGWMESDSGTRLLLAIIARLIVTVETARRDIFAQISVGDVRAASDELRAFFDERDRAGEGFQPEDAVACVLDRIRERRLSAEKLAKLPPF